MIRDLFAGSLGTNRNLVGFYAGCDKGSNHDRLLFQRALQTPGLKYLFQEKGIVLIGLLIAFPLQLFLTRVFLKAILILLR